ncbi:MAG: phosphoglucosamine mutase [Eubacterium aggregans]|uniref:Phosphoglucosamine mutase n=1 Tax=Eubacterium aggregans TaxID=81409 RepID=A0A1H4D982_9FIRM|nr:phosphoglucosamine mutase [Eubacterium aggregans]MDD4690852.1 phosphoglucosamine mutase [Eubacterium aggregans]MEA5074370.1 phosphoglucosamine mutase [Eubacterium aggregans]SEA69315.1 phosphoglucosamine mutase [Eubacterium aggregans]
MSRLFGTDGVRGVFGEELTIDLAYNLGRYGSYLLAEGSHHPKIVIGMDTRESGKPLEQALVEGITSVGGEVLLAGVIPTPAIAVITRELGADAGIVISASHNPYQFNGIKFFDAQGYKLPDALEDQIEALINECAALDDITAKGSVSTIDHPETIYFDHITKGISKDLTGVKLVLDCANGASAAIAKDFFESIGAQVSVIGDQPDGQNINCGCGSTCLKTLQEMMADSDADLGLAFDGDADRCLAVDEKGQIIDGDAILNLIGRHMKSQGCLKKDTVVVTVMSNIGLDLALKEVGCKSIKTQVGDRYVLEEMRANDYNIGGEQSGHVILLDHNTTGDGMLTALYLATIIKNSPQKASELNALMTSYPQVLVNAKVANTKKHDYLGDAVIQDEIQKVESHFAGQGRVLIRPSGTEPLVRVMIEGNNQRELEKIAGNLASLIEERLV